MTRKQASAEDIVLFSISTLRLGLSSLTMIGTARNARFLSRRIFTCFAEVDCNAANNSSSFGDDTGFAAGPIYKDAK